MIVGRIDAAFESAKELEKNLQSAKLELSMAAAQEILTDATLIEGVSVFAKELQFEEEKFKNLLDGVQAKLDESSVAFLFNRVGDSGSIAVVASKGVQQKGLKAGDLVKQLAELAGGKGGGRPDRAQAGTREQIGRAHV